MVEIEAISPNQNTLYVVIFDDNQPLYIATDLVVSHLLTMIKSIRFEWLLKIFGPQCTPGNKLTYYKKVWKNQKIDTIDCGFCPEYYCPENQCFIGFIPCEYLWGDSRFGCEHIVVSKELLLDSGIQYGWWTKHEHIVAKISLFTTFSDHTTAYAKVEGNPEFIERLRDKYQSAGYLKDKCVDGWLVPYGSRR